MEPQNKKYTVTHATTPSDLAAINKLFSQYAATLSSVTDLSFQNFTSECESLPGAYAPPDGVLLLARFSPSDKPPTPQSNNTPPKDDIFQGEPVGCIALRPLSSTSTKTCEMKRLYLTPSSRGLGIGQALVENVIREARMTGYEEMKLDTLATMGAARGLYEKYGFVETEKYYENPLEGVVFMKLKL